MASPVRPVAKCVYVCDDVVGDPASGKVSVLNLWDSVRFPAEQGFPYQLAKLCVFVWWRGGLGAIRTSVDIVQASSNRLIRRTRDSVVRFPERTTSVYACYRLPDCQFPEAGDYLIEVYCEGEFVDDQVIRVLQS